MAAIASVGLVVAPVAGCSTDDPSASGPLSASLGTGGVSVARPPNAGATWSATFGSLLICSPEAVTLAEVVPHYRTGEAVSVDFRVRTVPGPAERPGPRIGWAPVGSAVGSPARMAAQGDLRFATLADVSRAVVDQPCSDDPQAAFTEVLTTVETDDDGAWIDRLDIRYEADGRSYSLKVEGWSYVVCGALLEQDDVC